PGPCLRRDPVSDLGPILRHRSGPSSSRVPLPGSWRVLKTRKDSNSHPPLPPRGVGGMHRTQFQKQKKKSFERKSAKIFCVSCAAKDKYISNYEEKGYIDSSYQYPEGNSNGRSSSRYQHTKH